MNNLNFSFKLLNCLIQLDTHSESSRARARGATIRTSLGISGIMHHYKSGCIAVNKPGLRTNVSMNICVTVAGGIEARSQGA